MRTRTAFRQTLAAGIAVLVIVLLAGCGHPAAPSAEASSTPVAIPAKGQTMPVRLVIIQDKSLSTGETRTPQLQLADVEPLLAVLGQVGGELAVGIIHDRSNLSFVRLRIDAPPLEPVAPPKADNPLERRKQDIAFRKLTQEFKAAEQTWTEEMQNRVAEFQRDVEPMLALAADARRSPVWDSVQRAELFLSERDAAEATPPRRYAVFITDGLDDVGARSVPIRSGAKVLMVNGSAQLGSLAAIQPQRFESIQAAVRFVVGSEAK